MAFNLPPAWDAGFALPDNVRDEGLQRRGFVTRMAPRGTYDNPKVGTGGYAVPNYVMKEGYGQGAYTSKWAPRGRYDIPVPDYLNARPQVMRERALPGGGTAVTIDALSGIDDAQLPALYQQFGARSANAVLSMVQRIPPAQRKKQLKVILDRIDPTLWSRTAKLADQYVKAGQKPIQALASALARTMSTGIAKEVVATGKNRQPPPGTGLLGLGCYRRSRLSAFGDTAAPKAGLLESVAAKLTGTTAQASQAAPKPGECRLGADGKPAFIWVPASGSVAGHWERIRAGQACSMVNASGGSVDIRDHPDGQGGGGITGGGTASGAAPDLHFKMLQVGPFAIPLDVGSFGIKWSQPLPAEWRAPINQTLSHDTDLVGTGMVDAKPGKIWNRLRPFLPGMPARVNQRFIGIRDGGGGSQGKLVQSAEYPVVRTTRPDNGEDWGMFMTVQPRDLSKPWDSTKNPYLLALEWKKIDKSWYESVWDWIVNVVSKIIDVVGDAIGAVADLACDLVSSPGGLAAGAAVGVAAGVGPTAGTAGAAIAQQACNSGAPPPPPPPPTVQESILPAVMIAGGAVAAILILTSKKKK